MDPATGEATGNIARPGCSCRACHGTNHRLMDLQGGGIESTAVHGQEDSAPLHNRLTAGEWEKAEQSYQGWIADGLVAKSLGVPQ